PDFGGALFAQQFFNYVQVHDGQLWLHYYHAGIGELRVFSYPLRNASTPVKTVAVSGSIAVLGGGSITIAASADLDFAVESSGNAVWVSDWPNSRIVRIT